MMVDQLELAQTIAESLGDEWTAKVSDYGDYARLSCKGTESISLRGNGWNWEASKRLIIRGIYPKWHNQSVLHRRDLPKITCAISRGGIAIARDIETKFLPRYWSLVEEIRQQIEQYEKAQITVAANAELFAQAVGGTVSDRADGQPYSADRPVVRIDGIRDMYGKAIVGTDTVNIELRQVPLALALQIGRVIGEYRQNDDNTTTN